jgi:serine/threonine protein phosphatase 1
MATPSARTIAIGDVHGCVDALDALVDAISPRQTDQIVFLGDLVDQGRDSCDVLNRVIELQRRCQVVVIMGNHEEMMLAARENPRAKRVWENCGGGQTINSYRFGGTLDDVPPEHWDLIGNSLPYYETDETIFTHANYLPDIPMRFQPEHQLRWALFDPAIMRPHYTGKPVVVGHTEQIDSEVQDLVFATCIDTACRRYGWLTAFETRTGQIWQASRWGLLRAPGEATQRPRLSELIGAKRAQSLANPAQAS